MDRRKVKTSTCIQKVHSSIILFRQENMWKTIQFFKIVWVTHVMSQGLKFRFSVHIQGCVAKGKLIRGQEGLF